MWVHLCSHCDHEYTMKDAEVFLWYCACGHKIQASAIWRERQEADKCSLDTVNASKK